MSSKLTPDTQVPKLEVKTLGGGTWSLAQQKPENFTMVVFYRGLHCPVCKAYLEKLQSLVSDYESSGFSVIALSMNTESLAQQTANEWNVSSLTIGHNLTEETARSWGLYISRAFKEGEADIFCEPGLFWVRPDGRLYMADVSNMPWARPDLEFLHSKIPFAVEHKYPSRGGA